MFENLREDIAQARKVHFLRPNWFSQNVKVYLEITTLPIIAYRFETWVRDELKVPVVRQIVYGFAIVLRRFIRNWTKIYIAPNAKIGPGLAIHTPWCVFIGGVTVGRNCIVQTGVAIHYEVKKLGDNVYFGPGAKAIGPVTIGNNVTVVANSLVLSDIPDNCTVVGVPARIRLPWRLPRTYLGRLPAKDAKDGKSDQPKLAATAKQS